MPYLLEKSRFGINFFAKRNTILLSYMYQVFIFLQDHLHFFLYFFFTFMEQLFLDDPIPSAVWRYTGFEVVCNDSFEASLSLITTLVDPSSNIAYVFICFPPDDAMTGTISRRAQDVKRILPSHAACCGICCSIGGTCGAAFATTSWRAVWCFLLHLSHLPG